MASFDAIDRGLLRQLQREARQPLRALADALGVSAPTCLRRIRRLESSGVIEGYAAQLSAAKLGLALLAYVEVVLTSPSGAQMRAFERRMQRCPEVAQVAEIAGDTDYVLTVRTRSLQEFSDFTRRHLASDAHIKSFRSLIVMREAKRERGLAF